MGCLVHYNGRIFKEDEKRMAKRTRHALDGRVSIHDSVQEMYERIHNDGLSNVFDRFDRRKKFAANFVYAAPVASCAPTVCAAFRTIRELC